MIYETTDPKFIDRLKSLWSDWQEVQEKIPTKTDIEPVYAHRWKEDLQDFVQDYEDEEVTYQVTKDEDKPDFTKESPAFYDQRQPAERRVRYGQTKDEINIDKALMSLWQEYAKNHMGFWKSKRMTYSHNMIYRSAARGTRSSSVTLLNLTPEDTIKAQNTYQKNAISVAGIYTPNETEWPKIGSQTMMSSGWGFVCSGHPIFASFEDVASQTQRMASEKAREFYSSSGLPKRAGIERVSSTEFDPRTKKMKGRHLRRFKKFTDEEVERYFEVMANPVVLSEKDIIDRINVTKTSGIVLDEVIIANWIIDAWYVEDIYQSKKFFNNALENNLITTNISFRKTAF